MAQRILALRKNEKNEGLYNDLFKTKDMSIVSSSPKVFSAIHKDDFGDEFHISDAELDAYVKGFIDAVNEANVGTVIDEYNKDSEVSFDDSGLDDDDIKLSLYRSFKSLYDKWVSATNVNGQNGYFFNRYGKDDNRSLFDHFNFINRVGQDVGSRAVIDTGFLTTIADSSNGEGPTQSLYTLMANILSKNNFDFWPTPADIPILTNDLSDEDVKDMFRPLDNKIEKQEAGPMFNCVYIAGSSRTLKDLNNKEGNCDLINANNNYDDDSFDIGDETMTDWPEDFKSTDKGLVAFKVRYGQESQSHFSSVELDQSEFKETQESLLIIDSLTNPKSDNKPSQTGKGNSLHDVYLTRSYNCKVRGLGNMSIQPLMYFKLDNVPMFRGTYFINHVSHTITPHNIETEFSGLRQPKITIPLVEEPVSILDLLLEQQETDEETTGETKNLSNLNGINTTQTNQVDIKQYTGEGLDPIINLVTSKESGGDYEIYNYGSSGGSGIKSSTSGSAYFNSNAIKLTDKTITQILNYQSDYTMFAVGKYQLIPITLKSVATKLNLLNSIFNKETQDTIGNYLFLGKRSNLGNYLKGSNNGTQNDLEKAVQDLGQEYASMPIITKNGVTWGDVSNGQGNKGYYGGKGPNPDNVKHSVGTIVNTLIKSRIQYSNKNPEYIPTYYGTT